jgi:hypothetical protein
MWTCKRLPCGSRLGGKDFEVTDPEASVKKTRYTDASAVIMTMEITYAGDAGYKRCKQWPSRGKRDQIAIFRYHSFECRFAMILIIAGYRCLGSVPRCKKALRLGEKVYDGSVYDVAPSFFLHEVARQIIYFVLLSSLPARTNHKLSLGRFYVLVLNWRMQNAVNKKAPKARRS